MTIVAEKNSALVKRLKTEIEACYLLDNQEKQFWLSELEAMPEAGVQSVLEKISSANQQFYEYLDLALAEDKNGESVAKLKMQNKQVYQKAMQLEEKSETAGEGAELEKLLKDAAQ